MTWSQKRSSKPPIRTSFRPEFKKWCTYLVCDKAKEQNEVATKEKQPKNLQGCSKNIYVSESVFLDGKTGALEMVTSYDLPVVAVENGFKSWTQWIPSKTSASPTWPIVLVLPLVTSQIHLGPKQSRGSRCIPSTSRVTCHVSFLIWPMFYAFHEGFRLQGSFGRETRAQSPGSSFRIV